jgi:hypothetical protein
VPLVHYAAAPAGLTARARLAAGAALAAISIGGCGADSSPKTTTPKRSVAAQPASTANCAYWRAVDDPDRYAVIRAVRSFAGSQVGSASGKRGRVLDDRVAYRVMDSYCARDFATGFKLYKLYTRAAAFGAR